MLDAVVSDSEKAEEEEGSDAEFVAMPKGGKKVRTSVSRPQMCHNLVYHNLVSLHSFCLFQISNLLISLIALVKATV